MHFLKGSKISNVSIVLLASALLSGCLNQSREFSSAEVEDTSYSDGVALLSFSVMVNGVSLNFDSTPELAMAELSNLSLNFQTRNFDDAVVDRYQEMVFVSAESTNDPDAVEREAFSVVQNGPLEIDGIRSSVWGQSTGTETTMTAVRNKMLLSAPVRVHLLPCVSLLKQDDQGNWKAQGMRCFAKRVIQIL